MLLAVCLFAFCSPHEGKGISAVGLAKLEPVSRSENRAIVGQFRVYGGYIGTREEDVGIRRG